MINFYLKCAACIVDKKCFKQRLPSIKKNNLSHFKPKSLKVCVGFGVNEILENFDRIPEPPITVLD